MTNRVEVKYTAGPNLHVTDNRYLDPTDGVIYNNVTGGYVMSAGYKPSGRPGEWVSDESVAVDILYLCQCAAKVIHDCPVACPVPGAQDIKNLHLAENAVPEVLSTEAKRDTGKPRFDLLEDGCPDALLDVVKVMTWAVEVKGYRAHSWKEVPEARRRYRAAMSRHRNALARGELLDDESSLPHEAHIACNAIFLAQLLYVQPE
ncbi:hypothetical protein phiGM223_34 [Pseudomonas phage phiGM22-3]|uniref:dATP/dGTP diphosphohydrolase N-terminal domain-containing protein n=1 Tax=Pseudomonas phage phiGM22-3 TaxID=2816462 RepID=A0A8T8IX20_9CAUD|nr:hypothetical protein phiGM223_34 [Pseudomonas phage phiGM22-3]